MPGWMKIFMRMFGWSENEMDKTLQPEDIRRAAKNLGVTPAHIKAVVDVESNGSGFLDDGRVKILFEAHKFSKYTNGKYDNHFPNISSRVWNRRLYKGGAKEWDRINQASGLDRMAAYKSASYGLFQIMGFNYQACGFDNVYSFVDAMKKSEGDHLDAFVQFIIINNMAEDLMSGDWKSFARKYNGPAYAANKYDEKLALAFVKYNFGSDSELIA